MCDIDLHIPIVIRKGMRTCTKCPLSNLLSFHRLSLNYKGFKTNFPSDFVPQNISNAWKKILSGKRLFEEMRALYKNDT